MRFVDNQEITDPRTNIALETYLVENRLCDEPLLLFYINEPSIIIGRNQNTVEEVNQTYVDAHGVAGAKLEGRNDLLIDGKKFSGNAMYVKNGRMTAHGTILFDADLDAVTQALKPRADKIESKGIKSVRSRVTNIKPFVAPEYKSLTTRQFRDALLLYIFGVKDRAQVPEYFLTDADWEKIAQIRAERFANWDWNYGKSPAFSSERYCKFPQGAVDFRFSVERGVIQSLKIYGDFFGMGDIADVEKLLTGIPYRREAVELAFKQFDARHYFGGIEAEALVDLLVG